MSTRGHKFGRQQQSHNDYDDDDGGYAAYGSGSGGYAGATSSVYEEDDGAFGGHYDDDSDEYDYDDEDDDDDEEDEAGRIDFKCNKLLVKYLYILCKFFFIYITILLKSMLFLKGRVKEVNFVTSASKPDLFCQNENWFCPAIIKTD